MPQARYNSIRNQYVHGETIATYLANGAIALTDGVHAIAKTSAAAMTLAPPTAGEEGMKMIITGATAFAHTVTLTEGIGGKGAAFDVMTFAAVGDTIELIAISLHWHPVGAPYGVVIS